MSKVQASPEGNFDPAELEKFAALADQFDPKGVLRVGPVMRS